MSAPQVQGQWDTKFNLSNVAVHLHLLPTGKVLYWGRRDNPGSMDPPSLNQHYTRCFLLDLSTLKSSPTAQEPKDTDNETVNLFCSGHTFRPDGTLFIIGGHVLDGMGIDQACVYDPFHDTFTAQPAMNGGRWYPTALTLPDGTVIAVSGSETSAQNNLVPQIFRTGAWQDVQSPGDVFSLYPRLYHDPQGKVFMAGPLAQSRFLDLSQGNGIGAWLAPDPKLLRHAGQREYAASAMYDSGKIIYVSGGGGDGDPPNNEVEIVDLNENPPQWRDTSNIQFGRRHHFATVLPDGTVLVTGGTKGIGFNNVSPGMPVHTPELWDPATGQWTLMAPEDDDRCYHHTALLLPDGRVLSAGSGEWAPNPPGTGVPNNPKDSITTAQIFNPPYLFKGPRPTVSNIPSEVNYNDKISINVGPNDQIGKVTFTRIGSVTHACNMNQSFTFLQFSQTGTTITATIPENHYLVPAGHYLLFVVSKAGVPSIAPIILLKPDVTWNPNPSKAAVSKGVSMMSRSAAHVPIKTLAMRNDQVIADHEKPPVVIGLTPACPYGLGPCWGGAFEALKNISDIDAVRPMPDPEDSTAFVYLKEDILPDIDVWRKQLRQLDRGAYVMRGIEMTISGTVTWKDRQLILAGVKTRPDLTLGPLQAGSRVEWDKTANAPKTTTEEEASAYTRLVKLAEARSLEVEVTGPLIKGEDNKLSLEVRQFITLTKL